MAFGAATEREVEHGAVEIECRIDVPDLQRDVVEADHAGLAGSGDRRLGHGNTHGLK